MNEQTKVPNVEIWTDGSCLSNPGVGGWAAILSDGKRIKEIAGSDPDTTNNRMELIAAIQGLSALKCVCNVTLYSDSQYLTNAFNKQWIYGWEQANWGKMSPSDPGRVNSDLWIQLLALTRKHNVNFVWVKGHAGVQMNERCDKLATSAAMQCLRNLPRGGSI